jgi:hypothetical protein
MGARKRLIVDGIYHNVWLGMQLGENWYRVKKVFNSTQYAPEDRLSVDTVRRICEDPEWEVELRPISFF